MAIVASSGSRDRPRRRRAAEVARRPPGAELERGRDGDVMRLSSANSGGADRGGRAPASIDVASSRRRRSGPGRCRRSSRASGRGTSGRSRWSRARPRGPGPSRGSSRPGCAGRRSGRPPGRGNRTVRAGGSSPPRSPARPGPRSPQALAAPGFGQGRDPDDRQRGERQQVAERRNSGYDPTAVIARKAAIASRSSRPPLRPISEPAERPGARRSAGSSPPSPRGSSTTTRSSAARPAGSSARPIAGGASASRSRPSPGGEATQSRLPTTARASRPGSDGPPTRSLIGRTAKPVTAQVARSITARNAGIPRHPDEARSASDPLAGRHRRLSQHRPRIGGSRTAVNLHEKATPASEAADQNARKSAILAGSTRPSGPPRNREKSRPTAVEAARAASPS